MTSCEFNPLAFFLSLDNKGQIKVSPSASCVPTPSQPRQDVIHFEHSEPNLHLCELAQCSASRFQQSWTRYGLQKTPLFLWPSQTKQTEAQIEQNMKKKKDKQ